MISRQTDDIWVARLVYIVHKCRDVVRSSIHMYARMVTLFFLYSIVFNSNTQSFTRSQLLTCPIFPEHTITYLSSRSLPFALSVRFLLMSFILSSIILQCFGALPFQVFPPSEFCWFTFLLFFPYHSSTIAPNRSSPFVTSLHTEAFWASVCQHFPSG